MERAHSVSSSLWQVTTVACLGCLAALAASAPIRLGPGRLHLATGTLQGPAKRHGSFLPVVLWHGLGDTCCNPHSIGAVRAAIEDRLPGVFVYSINSGTDGSESQDQWSSFFGDVNQQVETACEKLGGIEELSGGYNAVGFSQGGSFLRAVAQRCSGPRMATLVTMGSPHQGVSAAPGCGDSSSCTTTQSLINWGAYIDWIQSSVVPAQYYKNVDDLETYMQSSIYLPDINNEGPVKNQTYVSKIKQLDKLVLVRFSDDQTVVPRDSAWFSWWAEDGVTMLDMEDTPLYKEDWIGLQAIDRAGKVERVECPGEHMQFTLDWFLDNVVDRHLRVLSTNTLHE